MTIRVLAVSPGSDLPETHSLIGLHQRGVKMTVLHSASSQNAFMLEEAGVPHDIIELNSRWDKAATKIIRQHLIDTQADILHMYTNRAVQNGLRASRGLNVKLIAYRGITGVEKVSDPISWMTFLNPRLDKIICVADAVRRHLVGLKLLWWKFPPDKAVTVYKGHDVSWYDMPPVPRSELGLPDDAIAVVCTVNDRPRKGLPYFLEAGKYLADVPNLHFVLIGNIDRQKHAAALAASGMKERVHFTGFRNDVSQVMAACNICILPAYKREGLPRGIIEGMATGVTPIVADAGGSPELIEHGVTGLVFAPASAPAIAEAIRRLCEDPAACAAMGQAAKARLQKHFHVSTTIDKTLAIYSQVSGKTVA